MNISATRLGNSPIISPHMDDRMGDNINGPSIIKVPDWVDNPLGKYYLYFAHHKGRYIRLAYADRITGPWHTYSSGVMDVEDSLFECHEGLASDIPIQSEWSDNFPNEFSYAHIASPHVIADHENRKIRMYYHGLQADGIQSTRVASSLEGLEFRAHKPILGPPYFRVFTYQQNYYAISWGGELWKSKHWDGPFEHGPRILPDQPDLEMHQGFRHGEVFVSDNKVIIFYSRIGDCPERIVYCIISATQDWNQWQAGKPINLLRPDRKWEGADCPLESSKIGAAENRVNELRDPCVFTDQDDQTYLFYAGAGESGIGLATLDGI